MSAFDLANWEQNNLEPKLATTSQSVSLSSKVPSLRSGPGVNGMKEETRSLHCIYFYRVYFGHLMNLAKCLFPLFSTRNITKITIDDDTDDNDDDDDDVEETQEVDATTTSPSAVDP